LLSIFVIPISTDEAPEWIELIPAGKFSAVDGRGPFENEDPDSIVAASVSKMPAVGLVLDYDHSTDLAAPEGRPAPAAGWLKGFKIQDGAIFARIEWTADAAEAVKEKKYRYVSPVFEHSKDGKVERILRAALTNNPALINLPALASAGVQRMEKEEKRPKLSEVMATLEAAYPEAHPRKLMEAAACLMADDDGDENEDMEEGGETHEGEVEHNAADEPYESEEQMAARHSEEMAKCASDDEREKMRAMHMAEITERNRGREIKPKAAEHKGEKSLTAAIAKHPMVVKMATELNGMREAQVKASATHKVDTAIREGRLIPSQREWAIEYCAADDKGFDKFIGAQPRIIQSGADNTFTARIGEAPKGVSSLSEREVEIFANLGLESKEQLEKCAAIKENWTLKFPRPHLMLDDSNSGVPTEGAK
jgi:phage I-like protein